MSAQYTIGLDYGTNSVRALIVNVANGQEVGTAVWGYAHGTAGVILGRDPNLARQHPADYLQGAESTIREETGFSVIAVRRNERLTVSPSPDLQLEEDDEIYVIGSAENAALFHAL